MHRIVPKSFVLCSEGGLERGSRKQANPSPKKKKCNPGFTTFHIIYRVSLLCSEYSDDGLYCKLL